MLLDFLLVLFVLTVSVGAVVWTERLSLVKLPDSYQLEAEKEVERMQLDSGEEL